MRIPHGRVLAAMAGIVVVSAATLTSAATGDNGPIKLDDGNGRIPLRAAMASQWQAQPPAAFSPLRSTRARSGTGGGPQEASRRPAFGFNDEGEALLSDIPAQVAAGATVARMPLPTFFVDLCCGHTWFDWTLPDRFYQELLAAGIRPIFSAWGTPPYVGDGPHEQPGDAPNSFPDLDWWAGFNARLAQRYPRAIIQVWNEPNQPAFGSLTVEQTVTLTTVAEQAIHAINPTQRVIGPATSPGMPGWQPFLRQVYEQLPDSVRVDASIHLYPGGSNPIQMLRRQYNRLARFGREIWVTEVGLSHVLYPTTQVKWTAKVYRSLDRFGAKGIIFHRLQEPTQGQEWEFRARLWALDGAGEPTGIFHALRTARRRPHRTPASAGIRRAAGRSGDKGWTSLSSERNGRTQR